VGIRQLSVIIPTFNEERKIRACIESARRLNPLEIIVADGGSLDNTAKIAEWEGATVICSPKGRGVQMNKGVSLAKGEILLFVHADTIFSDEIFSLFHPVVVSGFQEILKRVQHDKTEIFDKYIGGFFRLKFDDDSLSTRFVEFFANLRARLFSLPYGDQAIFMKKDMFDKIGGFKEYPFLEDIDMAIRIRKFGKLKYIPLKVIASSRRLKKGYPLSPIFVSLRNVFIALFFVLGVKPSKLIKLYA
jgi:rSAM/selenodomain-associated transferase 2